MEIRHYSMLPSIIGTLDGKPHSRIVRTVTECTDWIETAFGPFNNGWVRMGPQIWQTFDVETGRWK